MANYSNLKAAINAVIKQNGQGEITGEVMNQVLTAMVNSLGSNYLFAGVATPSTNPGTPDQNVFYMATQAGTYTNFSAIVLQAGISILLWDGSWSSETFFEIDSVPTSGSDNLISSGAVFDKFKLDGGAYDVSAHNSNQTFASLSALLTDANLSTLIPTNIRSGGMSIKFIQSSDNNYVKFFCTAQNFTTDVTQWQGVDEFVGQTSNLVESSAVHSAIQNLAEIQEDGSDSNLDVSDENGNVIVRYKDGEIETKNFDSAVSPKLMNDNSNSEFDITDEKGKVIIRCKSGEIETKKFNSALSPNLMGDNSDSELDIADENGKVALELKGGHIKTKNFDSRIIEGNQDNTIIKTNNVFSVGENACWCFPCWIWPVAITTEHSFRKKLIWGFVGNNGKIGVCQKDLFSQEVIRYEREPTTAVDLHNNCAVIELADGRIAYISTKGHDNAAKKVYYNISTNVGDCSTFSGEQEISGFTGKTTYAQVFYINSTYYIFVRNTDFEWWYTSSSDFENWSAPHQFITSTNPNQQYYLKIKPVSDRPNLLRMVMYSNPTYHDTNIRLGYIDTESGNVYNNVVDNNHIVGTLMGAAISKTSFDIIISKPSNKEQRLYDLAISSLDTVQVVFSRFTDNIQIHDSEYFVYENGVVTKLCNGGLSAINGKLQNGLSFINSDNIALSRNENGKDYIELWGKVDTQWTKTEKVYSEDIDNYSCRNFFPIADTSSRFLLWCRGTLDPEWYTTFNLDTIVKYLK